MKISARNQLPGTIVKLNTGVVYTEVTLEIAPGLQVTAVITKASAEALHLAVGQKIVAIIKASDVMIGVD